MKSHISKNYAAQAERSLLSIDENSVYYKPFSDFAKEINRAVHFSLPDDGIIFDDDLKGLKSGVKEFRLPYPVITLEYRALQENIRDSKTQSCPKRLVLAKECEFEGRHIIAVFAACYYQERDQWLPLTMGFGIDWDGEIDVERTPSGLSFGIRGGFLICNEPHYNDVKKRIGDESEDKLIADFWPEMRVLLEFMEALSCSNVKPKLIEPVDVQKQRRRAADGKLPIYETYVLTIPGNAVPKKDYQGGNHASPRQHLRRGHIRHLPSGNIWVNSCVVGDPSKGIIEKQYEVHL
jgi:hypothetical protein